MYYTNLLFLYTKTTFVLHKKQNILVQEEHFVLVQEDIFFCWSKNNVKIARVPSEGRQQKTGPGNEADITRARIARVP